MRIRCAFPLLLLSSLWCGGSGPNAPTDVRMADEAETAEVGVPSEAIPWATLANPILWRPDRMLKDASVVRGQGRFYAFASVRLESRENTSGSQGHAFYFSHDLREWTEFQAPEVAWAGSPDVSFADGAWRMVFQRHVPGESEHARRLFLSRSDDLMRWQEPRELLPRTVFPNTRVIDGALAFHEGEWALVFKAADLVWTVSASSLGGPWSDPMPVLVDGEWVWSENYQCIHLDGVWHVLATGRDPANPNPDNPYTDSHEPFLHRVVYDESGRPDFSRWTDKRMLLVPREPWNARMHANSAFLADWRDLDGHYYLFYAGSEDGESFQGRGHAKIGVARSRDLITWDVPPGGSD